MSATLSIHPQVTRARKSVKSDVCESALCQRYRERGYDEGAIVAIKEWERTKDTPECKYVSLVDAMDCAGYMTIEEAERIEYIFANEEFYSSEEIEKEFGMR